MSTDYYLLDELLTDEARDIRDRVRAFVDSDVLPVINDYWDRAEFPWALVPKLAGLGIVGSTIGGYGCPGLSRLAAGMATVEMSRGDGSVNTFLGVRPVWRWARSTCWAARSRSSAGCPEWPRWT